MIMSMPRRPDVVDYLNEHEIPYDHTGDSNNPYLFLDCRNFQDGKLPPGLQEAIAVAGLAIIRFPSKSLGRRTPQTY